MKPALEVVGKLLVVAAIGKLVVALLVKNTLAFPPGTPEESVKLTVEVDALPMVVVAVVVAGIDKLSAVSSVVVMLVTVALSVVVVVTLPVIVNNVVVDDVVIDDVALMVVVVEVVVVVVVVLSGHVWRVLGPICTDAAVCARPFGFHA
jgi:hypothetical protein